MNVLLTGLGMINNMKDFLEIQEALMEMVFAAVIFFFVIVLLGSPNKPGTFS